MQRCAFRHFFSCALLVNQGTTVNLEQKFCLDLYLETSNSPSLEVSLSCQPLSCTAQPVESSKPSSQLGACPLASHAEGFSQKAAPGTAPATANARPHPSPSSRQVPIAHFLAPRSAASHLQQGSARSIGSLPHSGSQERERPLASPKQIAGPSEHAPFSVSPSQVERKKDKQSGAFSSATVSARPLTAPKVRGRFLGIHVHEKLVFCT